MQFEIELPALLCGVCNDLLDQTAQGSGRFVTRDRVCLQGVGQIRDLALVDLCHVGVPLDRCGFLAVKHRKVREPSLEVA